MYCLATVMAVYCCYDYQDTIVEHYIRHKTVLSSLINPSPSIFLLAYQHILAEECIHRLGRFPKFPAKIPFKALNSRESYLSIANKGRDIIFYLTKCALN